MEKFEQIMERLDALAEMPTKVGTVEEQLKAETAKRELLETELRQAVETIKGLKRIGVSTGFDSESVGKRFLEWFKSSMRPSRQKAMAGDSDPVGGYLVPQEFVPTLIELIKQYGLFRAGATVVPMASDELVMPSLLTDITVYWPASQGSEITASTPTFGRVTLTAKTMAALVEISNELLEDSSLDVANLVANLFARAVAKEEDRVGFKGRTAVSDPANGIMYTAGIGTVTMDVGRTSFQDLSYDDLTYLVDECEDDDGAGYILHRTIVGVCRRLKDKNGNPIWQPAAGSEPSTICGYPYKTSHIMPSASDTNVNTPFVIFGNLSYAYLGDRKQMAVESSPHANFKYNQTVMRMVERIAFAIPLGQAFSVLKTASNG